jgi:membrane protease YdiL (CAAX protease family)
MRIGWRRVGWYFALTLLLLLLIPLIHTISGGGALDFDAAAARASAETGLAWTSNLWVVVRLCLAEPTLWLLVLGSAVPSLAALIVCCWSGPAQIRRLLTRFRPVGNGTPWRDALPSYGVLTAVLPPCLLAVYALRSLLPGPEYSQPAGIFGPALAASLLTAAFLDQGAVLEELGWRGYALPELQAGLLSPLGAAVLVGVGWGLWHVPRDVVAGVIDRLGLLQYLLLFLPAFVSGTVTMSIIAAYFVNRSGGSVIPAIMVHGLGNDAVGLSGVAAMDVALTPYHQATKVLPFAVLAACIVALSGRRLGLARVMSSRPSRQVG